MFIHIRSSAPKMFIKFGWQTRTFCHRKWKKRLPNSSQTDYRCRAALTTYGLEWLEQWGSLAKLKLKWSTRELVYIGNTHVTQSP